MTVVPELRRLGQEDCEFKANLNIETLFHKNKQTKTHNNITSLKKIQQCNSNSWGYFLKIFLLNHSPSHRGTSIMLITNNKKNFKTLQSHFYTPVFWLCNLRASCLVPLKLLKSETRDFWLLCLHSQWIIQASIGLCISGKQGRYCVKCEVGRFSSLFQQPTATTSHDLTLTPMDPIGPAFIPLRLYFLQSLKGLNAQVVSLSVTSEECFC
jgi:hypothetical protein